MYEYILMKKGTFARGTYKLVGFVVYINRLKTQYQKELAVNSPSLGSYQYHQVVPTEVRNCIAIDKTYLYNMYHNICFWGEIRKILCGYPRLSAILFMEIDHEIFSMVNPSFPLNT